VVAQQCPSDSEEAPRGWVGQSLVLPAVVYRRLTLPIYRYVIAIVSNQGGINLTPDPKTAKSSGKRLADFKGKVSAVLNQLQLPITVYAATSRDEYRKPRTGMWRELLDDHDLDSIGSVDLEHSFFVGDAGGREAVVGQAVKDHSCSDR
jgi:bifunctional polynucleotide phosphatase/kinase